MDDLNGQTAPESTRGLFDPPADVKLPSRPTSTSNAEKRRSALVFSAFSHMNIDSTGQSSQPRSERGHQRSRSAVIAPPFDGSPRASNGTLHTLEEEGGNVDRRYSQQPLAGRRSTRSFAQQESIGSADGSEPQSAMSSLRDMINTLKQMPPDEPMQRTVLSHRKQQSMSSVPAYSRQNRLSQHDSVNAQTLRNIADNRRNSAIHSKHLSMSDFSRLSANDDDEDDYMSRADALAEAEAKLMGTYQKPERQRDTTDDTKSQRRSRQIYAQPGGGQFNLHENEFSDQRHSRRLSEPNAAKYDPRRFSDMPETSTSYTNNRSSMSNKRMSLHMPTLNEMGEDPNRHGTSRRINFNKPLDLGQDSNKRRSRNFDDWRSSASPIVPSSRNPANRNSFHLVPFTPTKVNFTRDDANPHQRRPLFTAHLPFSALTPLLKSRQLVRGSLRVNKRNRSDAYVTTDDLDADVYICGSRDRNRALDGDVVAIKLVDVDRVLREKKEKEEAKLIRNGGQPRVRKPDEEDDNEIVFGGDEDIDKVKPKYCGIVVAILERAQNQVFSGILTLMRPNNKRAQEEKAAEEARRMSGDSQFEHKETPRIVWFKPSDKRVPLIAIPIEQVPENFVTDSEGYQQKLFVGSIKRWPITSLHPFGVLEREIGLVSDITVQTQALLADNNVTDSEFSEAVMNCLPELPWTPEEADLEDRREFKDVRVFTIEEQKQADILDRALSIIKVGDDTYEIGLHMADVAHFIKPHSPLDKEARARATVVEVVNKTVPMLPAELTSQVTNFVAGKDRLAFSVVWTMNSTGKVLGTWIGKSVVNAAANVSLDDVQQVVQGSHITATEETSEEELHGLEQDIQLLHDIAQRLRESRTTKGIFTAEKEQLNINLQDNLPASIDITEPHPMEELVNEFEVMANVVVAQKISSNFPEQALLRRQGGPHQRKMDELYEYAESLGYPLNDESPGTLQSSLDEIEDIEIRHGVTALVLKTLQPPKYFCTGVFDIIKYAHFSLNTPLYTHFTRPSRRYADIIIHRQMEATLAGEKRFYIDRDTIQTLSQHCNVKQEAARWAKYQSGQLFLSRYLQGVMKRQVTTAVTHEALVVAVFDHAFDVVLPEYALERRIHLDNLPIEAHKLDHAGGTLTLAWKKGVRTSGHAAVRQRECSSDDDDNISLIDHNDNDVDPDLADTVHKLGVNLSDRRTSVNGHRKRMSVVLSTESVYDDLKCTQTIKALDKIKVVIMVEGDRTPPVIKVLAANTFA
ncbi:hypothetical protein INT44_005015 [Umbelopsis vinacea]|uniref:RNB domain-containing protein n=1 Tax=Umbelopsis vinacea TaxID=44442 RepID=A0A8H7UQK9_9FUNG|nr:hypothetical protein INT44_005015 [Umbelopsis vinacea]